uniref:Uncharacterized protein n=1 Tax=Trypanosoma congolense (strain IL3000) TaxID=1068625 RepID=G0UR55_TRYCI|nr:hypothetical protein, unlikely [Trypanosoma congolense IL3000]
MRFMRRLALALHSTNALHVIGKGMPSSSDVNPVHRFSPLSDAARELIVGRGQSWHPIVLNFTSFFIDILPHLWGVTGSQRYFWHVSRGCEVIADPAACVCVCGRVWFIRS